MTSLNETNNSNNLSATNNNNNNNTSNTTTSNNAIASTTGSTNNNVNNVNNVNRSISRRFSWQANETGAITANTNNSIPSNNPNNANNPNSSSDPSQSQTSQGPSIPSKESVPPVLVSNLIPLTNGVGTNPSISNNVLSAPTGNPPSSSHLRRSSATAFFPFIEESAVRKLSAEANGNLNISNLKPVNASNDSTTNNNITKITNKDLTTKNENNNVNNGSNPVNSLENSSTSNGTSTSLDSAITTPIPSTTPAGTLGANVNGSNAVAGQVTGSGSNEMEAHSQAPSASLSLTSTSSTANTNNSGATPSALPSGSGSSGPKKEHRSSHNNGSGSNSSNSTQAAAGVPVHAGSGTGPIAKKNSFKEKERDSINNNKDNYLYNTLLGEGIPSSLFEMTLNHIETMFPGLSSHYRLSIHKLTTRDIDEDDDDYFNYENLDEMNTVKAHIPTGPMTSLSNKNFSISPPHSSLVISSFTKQACPICLMYTLPNHPASPLSLFLVMVCPHLSACVHVVHLGCLTALYTLRSTSALLTTPSMDSWHRNLKTNFIKVEKEWTEENINEMCSFSTSYLQSSNPASPINNNNPVQVPLSNRSCLLEVGIAHLVSNAQISLMSWPLPLNAIPNPNTGIDSICARMSSHDTNNTLARDGDEWLPAGCFHLPQGKFHIKLTDLTNNALYTHVVNFDMDTLIKKPGRSNKTPTTSTSTEKNTSNQNQTRHEDGQFVVIDPLTRNVLTIGIRIREGLVTDSSHNSAPIISPLSKLPPQAPTYPTPSASVYKRRYQVLFVRYEFCPQPCTLPLVPACTAFSASMSATSSVPSSTAGSPIVSTPLNSYSFSNNYASATSAPSPYMRADGRNLLSYPSSSPSAAAYAASLGVAAWPLSVTSQLSPHYTPLLGSSALGASSDYPPHLLLRSFTSDSNNNTGSRNSAINMTTALPSPIRVGNDQRLSLAPLRTSLSTPNASHNNSLINTSSNDESNTINDNLNNMINSSGGGADMNSSSSPHMIATAVAVSTLMSPHTGPSNSNTTSNSIQVTNQSSLQMLLQEQANANNVQQAPPHSRISNVPSLVPLPSPLLVPHDGAGIYSSPSSQQQYNNLIMDNSNNGNNINGTHIAHISMGPNHFQRGSLNNGVNNNNQFYNENSWNMNSHVPFNHFQQQNINSSNSFNNMQNYNPSLYTNSNNNNNNPNNRNGGNSMYSGNNNNNNQYGNNQPRSHGSFVQQPTGLTIAQQSVNNNFSMNNKNMQNMQQQQQQQNSVNMQQSLTGQNYAQIPPQHFGPNAAGSNTNHRASLNNPTHTQRGSESYNNRNPVNQNQNGAVGRSSGNNNNNNGNSNNNSGRASPSTMNNHGSSNTPQRERTQGRNRSSLDMNNNTSSNINNSAPEDLYANGQARSNINNGTGNNGNNSRRVSTSNHDGHLNENNSNQSNNGDNVPHNAHGLSPPAGLSSIISPIPPLSSSDGSLLNLSYEQVVGNVVRLAKTHSGSLFIQHTIDNSNNGASDKSGEANNHEDGNQNNHDNLNSSRLLNLFFNEMLPCVSDIMIDNFGHFAMEKLISTCDDSQTLALLQRASPQLAYVACHKHGSFSVQALVDAIRTPAQMWTLVEAVQPDVIRIITNASGHFVILRMLAKFPYEVTKFIDNAVQAEIQTVAIDHHGLRVIKALLTQRITPQTPPPSENDPDSYPCMGIFRAVISNSLSLVENQYGNYVIQAVLECGPPQVRSLLKESMIGCYLRLSLQKFSSNVVEKCLQLSSPNSIWRDLVIDELCAQPSVSDLLRDRYGNYVLQTALAIADDKQQKKLESNIVPHLNSLRENVRTKWKKMLKNFSPQSHSSNNGSPSNEPINTSSPNNNANGNGNNNNNNNILPRTPSPPPSHYPVGPAVNAISLS